MKESERNSGSPLALLICVQITVILQGMNSDRCMRVGMDERPK